MFNYGAAERHHFDRYWNIVEALVPYRVAPEKNLWLQHLDRRYDGDLNAGGGAP